MRLQFGYVPSSTGNGASRNTPILAAHAQGLAAGTEAARLAMPHSAPRPCAHPGCPALVAAGRCPPHKRERQIAIDARRGNRHQRGYSNAWYRAVKIWIAQNPERQFCADPFDAHAGRRVMGTETDHRVPHRGNQGIFWDRTNWQRLCRSCHSRKTMSEMQNEAA